MASNETDSPGINNRDMERMKAAAESGHARDLSHDPNDHTNSSDATPTRERVLTESEFERLLIGAPQLDGTRGDEAWAAIVILGRLGLRGGELTHFSEEWVDFQKQKVQIPARDPCTKGRGGGVCGNCRIAIKQRQKNGDDRDFEEIAEDYWQPKTPRAVRDVPFGWSARAHEAISMLLRDGGWGHSYSTIQRRLGNALDAAPGLDQEKTSLHGLRGTAASYHAGNGVDKEAIKSMMGWADDRTPEKYLLIDADMSQRALRRVYG